MTSAALAARRIGADAARALTMIGSPAARNRDTLCDVRDSAFDSLQSGQHPNQHQKRVQSRS